MWTPSLVPSIFGLVRSFKISHHRLVRTHSLIALLFLLAGTLMYGEPPGIQIARDAADFHKFRLAVLAAGAEVSRQHPNSNAGAEYVSAECRKLARRTTPDYLFGVFADLAQDTSHTEEPYLIGENLAVVYPPETAKKVLRELQKNKSYNSGEIEAWIEDIEKSQRHESD